jgi:rod shape-determining protein MreB
MSGFHRLGAVRPAGWSRNRHRSGLALDLGSLRTREWIPDHGLVVDAPTMTTPPTGVSYPISRGRITDVPGTSACSITFYSGMPVSPRSPR